MNCQKSNNPKLKMTQIKSSTSSGVNSIEIAKIRVANCQKSSLTIAVDKMQDVETVSLGVFVNTGSRNETAKNNGISHFLEHMAFKGTRKRTALAIAEEIEAIGGYINAYTSREKTVYYVKILKKHLEFAVEFLSDIIQNSTFDKIELEKERGVILQEIAMTNDTPDDIVFDYFQNATYEKQPIGRSILGPESNIKKFQQQDFFDYVNSQYNVDNIAISAAGATNIAELSALVAKYFTNLNLGKAKKSVDAKYCGGEFRKQKKLEQNNILLGFRAFGYKDARYYQLQTLAMILGSGMSSRLFQEIREKRGLAYSIYAFNQCYRDCGVFTIYAGTSPEKTNELLEATIMEIKKITNNINEAEVNKVKTQFESSILMAKESTSGRMQKLGNNLLDFGKYIDSNHILSEVNKITVEQLQGLACEIFFSNKPSFAMVGNKNSAMSFDEITTKLN